MMHIFMEKLLDFKRGRVEDLGFRVEWRKLGDVSKVLRGKRLTRNLLSDNEKYPVYHGGLEPLGYYKDKNRPADTVMIINVGASAGTVGYSDVDFWSSDGCFCIEHTNFVDNKYLYYLLIGYQHLLRSRVRVAGIPTLDAKVVEKLQILIPSLEVQREIVRILDNFTELTAELSARRKQYSYYRDQLLSFGEDEVEWRKLGEVTLPTKNIKWQDTEHTYRYIDLSSVSRENNKIIETIEISAKNAPSRAKKLVKKDDVIFATTRPTQQRLCLISNDYSNEVASTGYCVLRANKEKILPKLIFYYISSTEFKNYVEENQSGSAYPAISDGKVKEFLIPIPPLEKQKEIVAILDKFDTLTNSISEGLPKEIELRQKQYAYYRDLLLDFPKEESCA